MRPGSMMQFVLQMNASIQRGWGSLSGFIRRPAMPSSGLGLDPLKYRVTGSGGTLASAARSVARANGDQHGPDHRIDKEAAKTADRARSPTRDRVAAAAERAGGRFGDFRSDGLGSRR